MNSIVSPKAPIPWDPDLVRAIAEEMKGLDGPMLPILHAINDRFGYVDEQAAPIIADVLNLTRAEVHGVISFYHDFHREPPRRHTIKMCQAEACQSMGAEKVYAQVEKACAAGNYVSLQPVYCLGNCALSPAALIDGKLYGRLDAEKTLDLVRK